MTLNTIISPTSTDNPLNDGRLKKAQLTMYSMLKIIDSICLKYNLDYWLDAGTLLGAVRHNGFIPWDDDADIAMTRDSFNLFLKLAPQELPNHMCLQTIHSDPGYYNMATPLKIRDRNSYYVEKHELGNEPYQQGIFIDVFVYDKLPVNKIKRKFYKFISKKISRILSTKYSVLQLGHYSKFYKKIGTLFSTSFLEQTVEKIINNASLSNSPLIGRGYHCVGTNCLLFEDVFPLKRIRFEDSYFNAPNNFHELLFQQFGDYLTLPPPEKRVLRHCKKLILELDCVINKEV